MPPRTGRGARALARARGPVRGLENARRSPSLRHAKHGDCWFLQSIGKKVFKNKFFYFYIYLFIFIFYFLILKPRLNKIKMISDRRNSRKGKRFNLSLKKMQLLFFRLCLCSLGAYQ
jgi:hypothetical protein